MKTQRVIIGAVLLVFFAILDPIFDLLVAGVALGLVLLLDGFNFFDRGEVQTSSPAMQTKLSALDHSVLEMISQSRSSDDIAKSTGVSSSVISEKISVLTSAGYVLNNMLTEKGFEALRS